MRKFGLVAGAVLACSGCVAAAPPEPMISSVTVTPARDDPACRDYTALATIGGTQQRVVGRACQQSDGSWRVREGTPQQPGQYMAVYPAPPYSYYDPWSWGPPIGLSLGSVIVLDRDRHFHRFRNFHHFAFDRPRDRFRVGGMHHGFMDGMHHGFGRGG